MKISTFNYVLAKNRMQELKITQQDLADYLTQNGIITPLNTVKSWFRKANRASPEQQKIFLIGQLLKLDANQMLSGFENKMSVVDIPIVGSASCGVPTTNVYDDVGEFTQITADEWNPDMYAIICVGDSMSGIGGIDDGDIVICDPRSSIAHGDIVHYQIGNESAIKVYIVSNDEILLVPINSDYPTLKLPKSGNIHMRKVVDIKKSVRNSRLLRAKMLGY